MLQQVLIIENRPQRSYLLKFLAESKQGEVTCLSAEKKGAMLTLMDYFEAKKFSFIIVNCDKSNFLNLQNLLEAVRVSKIPFAFVSKENQIKEYWYEKHALWSLGVTDEMHESNILLHKALKEVFALPAFVTT